MRRMTIGIAVALAACGTSSAEVRTAQTAQYQMAPGSLLELAEAAAAETYKLGPLDADGLGFRTEPRVYSKSGDLESPGAEGWVRARNGSVSVQFLVRLHDLGGGSETVTVTPKTYEVIGGSPQPRELMPDDPYLPPWVHGRADALAVAIYDRAHQSAAPGSH